MLEKQTGMLSVVRKANSEWITLAVEPCDAPLRA
jgi:hypothetical protein